MALTLKQHFSYSKLDTLILKSSYGSGGTQTSGNVCTFYCSQDITCPPSEIVEIKEIKAIEFNFCPNLDLIETFLMLGDVPNLVKLQLKSCNIQQLPPEIWALSKIRHLKLGNEGYGPNNEFTTFPPEVEHLQDLEELNLHDNYHFTEFPAEIAKLKNLRALNLRGFQSLPKNIELIPNLERLYLVFSGIVPSHIEPLLARGNGLKSVIVGEHYFYGFNKLAERYPGFSVSSERTTLRGDY